MPLHIGKGRTVSRAIADIIDYVKDDEKTDHGQLITSYQCNSKLADAEFTLSKKIYEGQTGRTRGADNVIAYHLRQSFAPGEITPEEANRLGVELAKRFTKGNHAFVVCTHIDQHHVHNHVIINSANLSCSGKFRNFWGSSLALRRLNDTICIENGYSIVENPQRHGKSYNKWLGDQAPLAHRDEIRQAIDEALAQNPKDFEELLEYLRSAGYTVKGAKNPSLLGGTQRRSIRMDTLGSGYTPDDLRAVLSGEKQHIPRQRQQPKKQNPAQGNQLLIDIQAKLTQGKGAGYEHWAKKFNLKQMAQTVAYLQDHDLTDYNELTAKADAAAVRYHELSDEIKSAEKRMAEISILQTQIIKYAKTRETYAAYRQSGYSKQFRAQHESEILLHQAAKKYFDAQGLKKLPSVKALRSEYAELLTRKKAAYADYRQARDEMKNLLIAKENIDRILGIDSPEKEPISKGAERK